MCGIKADFAMFDFGGQCIALMDGHFDAENPDKVIHKGGDYYGF